MINALETYKDVLATFGLVDESVLELISSAWLESHRYWHTLDNHLLPLLKQIDERKAELTKEEYEALIIIAIFHDIVYDPKRKDNERQSTRVFQELVKSKAHPLHKQIEKAILETEWGKEPTSKISRMFQELDTSILQSEDLSELIAYEQAIFREYQFLDFKTYRKERIRFLESCLEEHRSSNYSALKWLIEYIQIRKTNICVYAGSFNPFHLGHFDVLQKAEKIFDKVILAVGINPTKPEEKLDERVANLKHTLPHHQVEGFKGFLTDFIDKLGYRVTIIRGLRNSFDLNYETTQLRLMEDMYPEVNVTYFLCSSHLQHISSSAIRMLRTFEKGREKKYLVPAEKNILEKLNLQL